jgi:hypothetical protein
LAARTYRVAELPDQWDVLWFIQDRLIVVAPLEEPPMPDQPVDVEVTIDIRLPYMQIAPMRYVGNKVHRLSRSDTAHGKGTVLSVSDTKLGLSLYSLTSEWAAGRYDLAGLLDAVRPRRHRPRHRDRRVADAPHLSRGHRRVRPGLAGRVRPARLRAQLVRRQPRHGPAPRPRHDPDEEYEFTATQFRSAHALGFPLVRIQSAKPR